MVDRLRDERFFKCELVKIQDANHLRVNIDVLGITLKNVKLKLYGVNMPQLKSKDPFVREAAQRCIREMRKFLKDGKIYTMRISGHDKYVAEVYPEELNGQTLNDYMLKNGFALYSFVKNF